MKNLTFEQCKKGYENAIPGSKEQAHFFAMAKAKAKTFGQC